jgi:putative ABC transport system permease protein
VVRALTKKLLRDLAHMRGPALTIALVVAAGIASFISLRGSYETVLAARDAYYSTQRFADVFCELERAPRALLAEIAALPGVARVEARAVGTGRVLLASLPEPADAKVVSIPEHGAPVLNDFVLVAGSMPSVERDDEALISEQFAEIHSVQPGDHLDVVLEGRKRSLRVAGLAMSPEFVLSMPSGAVAAAPDRFAVLWMRQHAVESTYDLAGAFNDLTIGLIPHAQPAQVVHTLDQLLTKYGTRGAYTREHQTSHRQLTENLMQIASIATLAPTIFLCVAAFLLNTELSRLIELDRTQIATLKALGYRNRDVGLHYLKLGLCIAAVGALLGMAFGSMLASKLVGFVVRFYRIPQLAFELTPALVSAALSASLGAALVGSSLAVRSVVRLAPAEAMRPPAPPRYTQSAWSRCVSARVAPASRMIARELSRRPLRFLASTLGIAVATGVIVLGQFQADAMKFCLDVYMLAQQRETMAVSFVQPMATDAVRSLQRLPGVRDVQWRAVLPVRVRVGHRERLVNLVAHPERHSLRPLLDEDAKRVPIERGAVLATDMLARVLGAHAGDTLLIEPLTGDRTPRPLVMTGTVSELLSLWIHMHEADFARWLGVAPLATEAHLLVDSGQVEAVQRELNRMPQVASAARKQLLIDEFRRDRGAIGPVFATVLTLFAATLALSITYNNARVSLSTRARELASLRVLGFSRAEVARVLTGELAVQVLLGVALGMLLGRALVSTMLASSELEAIRFTKHIGVHAYALAALVTLSGGFVSAQLVRRKLDKLDMTEALKTRQ